MKTSNIFTLISQLPKEKLLSLFTKLFERNVISMMFLKEAHERSGYLLRHVEAYQDFLDKISSGSEGLSEKTSLRILSYLFLHFEILRYWGVAPQSMNMSERAIPYVTTVTKNPNELLSQSYQEVCDKHCPYQLQRGHDRTQDEPTI